MKILKTNNSVTYIIYNYKFKYIYKYIIFKLLEFNLQFIFSLLM